MPSRSESLVPPRQNQGVRPPRGAVPPARSSARTAARGFGLLELLTTLAFLVIVMGLMVSLARYVRATSAEQITQHVLRQLSDGLTERLRPGATPLPDPDGPVPRPGAPEPAWADYARRSNTAVRLLAGSEEPVTDAWGNPIGYLAFERSEIGMAPHDRPFCFSAGPDGRYLTQDDNLYSYEQLAPQLAPSPPPPGGHGE